MTLASLVAVPAAIGAAAAFGTAGVLQHRATHQTPDVGALNPRLLLNLIRLQAFRGGVLLGIVGFALQVVALRYGPLILVQPMLVTGVLFYLVLASRISNRPMDRILLAGATMALAGLAAFLAVAQPSSGQAHFSTPAALPLGIGLIGVVAICLVVTKRVPDEMRALPLAAATAVCFGVTAGLVRSLISGPLGAEVLHEWELYAVILVGPTGFLLNQNAFQKGRVGSVSLTIITVGDPLVAIGLGIAWLGESIATWPAAIAGEVLALAVMVSGVSVLAGRAQRLAEQLQEENQLEEGAA